MTQPGETDGLDVTGHIQAIEAQLSDFGVKERIFNLILAQKALAPSKLLDYYLSRGAEPVYCDFNSLRSQGYRVFAASLQEMKLTSRSVLRHDPRRLSLAVMRVFRRDKKDT